MSEKLFVCSRTDLYKFIIPNTMPLNVNGAVIPAGEHTQSFLTPPPFMFAAKDYIGLQKKYKRVNPVPFLYQPELD